MHEQLEQLVDQHPADERGQPAHQEQSPALAPEDERSRGRNHGNRGNVTEPRDEPEDA